jgi:hypothetical protein
LHLQDSSYTPSSPESELDMLGYRLMQPGRNDPKTAPTGGTVLADNRCDESTEAKSLQLISTIFRSDRQTSIEHPKAIAFTNAGEPAQSKYNHLKIIDTGRWKLSRYKANITARKRCYPPHNRRATTRQTTNTRKHKLSILWKQKLP